MDVIYLQQEESLCGRTWCEDKINDSDEKYINIKTIKEKFRHIISGKGMIIPRAAIEARIKELEDL